VRTLCPSCSRPTNQEDTAGIKILQRLTAASNLQGVQANFRKAVGCDRCGKSGYLGRIAISELLIVDDEIRQAILERADEMRIDRIARANGLIPLGHAGARRVFAGETTLDELVRVTGERFEL
jgi:general secretion pathway protein E